MPIKHTINECEKKMYSHSFIETFLHWVTAYHYFGVSLWLPLLAGYGTA